MFTIYQQLVNCLPKRMSRILSYVLVFLAAFGLSLWFWHGFLSGTGVKLQRPKHANKDKTIEKHLHRDLDYVHAELRNLVKKYNWQKEKLRSVRKERMGAEKRLKRYVKKFEQKKLELVQEKEKVTILTKELNKKLNPGVLKMASFSRTMNQKQKVQEASGKEKKHSLKTNMENDPMQNELKVNSQKQVVKGSEFVEETHKNPGDDAEEVIYVVEEQEVEDE